MRQLLFFSLFSLLVSASALEKSEEVKLHALYLMQQNKVEEAINRYREYTHLTGHQDFEALQQMGIILLSKGIQDPDPQTYLMTLFGAGLSGSSNALDILESGLYQQDPNIQLLALHFISQFEEDKTSDLLNIAMGSDFLSTRMEAAFYMAQRKHPLAMGQIEGLMFRLPPMFKPYFPSFFVLLGTSDATQAIKRLIEDPDFQVRVETILNVARAGRDDFLPTLRKRLTHSQVAELEAAAFAVGVLKDSASLPKLKKLATSPIPSVRLAASLALFRLGERSTVQILFELAKKENLFAIYALGEVEGSEDLLFLLSKSEDLQVRVNATLALLQRRDSRALSGLAEILIDDSRNLAFFPFASVGRTLVSIRAATSADLRTNDPSVNASLSTAMREHFLREAIHLPPSSFLLLARLIIQKQQHDLIPTLIALLENLRTDEAIALLKQGTQKLTSPLIRDYCNLSLYRLKEEGPYEEQVTHWIMRQKGEDLIRFRPLLPWKFRLEQADYSLTPDETSHLLIESFLSVANQRDEKSINFLLEAIQYSNPANRYALMGLLMKATE
ncbi:MAG TPA: HEAT repeat domain-containing protein [Chlamydiales bacterium]|nr:HEAT repeat domain-containing protein [Chlamydiales bacterium]